VAATIFAYFERYPYERHGKDETDFLDPCHPGLANFVIDLRILNQ
jgi:hypothetical protein